MKKLNEQEMAKVSGGYKESDSSMSKEEILRHKGSPVGKYDGIEGNTYIFSYPNEIVIGKLIRTYEKETTIYGNTVRTHDVQVIDICVLYKGSIYGLADVGRTVEFRGDQCDMNEYIA